MTAAPRDVVRVCILAHNEQKGIARTLAAILAPYPAALPFEAHVYANGCTDGTVAICRALAAKDPRIVVHELALASKPHAWNTALAESATEFVVFSDGDIVPDPGAVTRLVDALRASPQAVIASCRQVATVAGADWQRRLVGFMMQPLLRQDFMAGGFYAVRRAALCACLERLGFAAMPLGVTGEDAFLQKVVGPTGLIVAACGSHVEPPDLGDYWRYLARMRWQGQQLALFLPAREAPAPLMTRVLSVLARAHAEYGPLGLLRVVPAEVSRRGIRWAAGPLVRREYQRLGPVGPDGTDILRAATRSTSTK